MMFLGACVTLCSLLALSRAGPVNTSVAHHMGRCQTMRDHGNGAFTPECDSDGNYLPQQCCATTGYCWCVNIVTGEEIHNTRGVQADYHYDCVKEHYCPYYWTQYRYHCLMFIDSPKTWMEAEMYCQFEGGNLASAHTYEEHHELQSLSRGNGHDFAMSWLGGNDAVQPGVWMWSDGSKFDYEDWYMDYYPPKNEHCLSMNFGLELKWHCEVCNKTLPFICSKSWYHG